MCWGCRGVTRVETVTHETFIPPHGTEDGVVISPDVACLAAFAFLELQHHRSVGQERDVWANLLSSMSLLPDGAPADPGIQADWLDCRQRAQAGNVDARLTFRSPMVEG